MNEAIYTQPKPAIVKEVQTSHFLRGIKVLAVIALAVMVSGCKSVEVVFTAKYQRGPLSLELSSR